MQGFILDRINNFVTWQLTSFINKEPLKFSGSFVKGLQIFNVPKYNYSYQKNNHLELHLSQRDNRFVTKINPLKSIAL